MPFKKIKITYSKNQNYWSHQLKCMTMPKAEREQNQKSSPMSMVAFPIWPADRFGSSAPLRASSPRSNTPSLLSCSCSNPGPTEHTRAGEHKHCQGPAAWTSLASLSTAQLGTVLQISVPFRERGRSIFHSHCSLNQLTWHNDHQGHVKESQKGVQREEKQSHLNDSGTKT